MGRLYLRLSVARRAYDCDACAESIARGQQYYRDSPYPNDRRRGAKDRHLCLRCVAGGAIPERSLGAARKRRLDITYPLPYESIGDEGAIYLTPSRSIELLVDLFPHVWVPPKTEHIEIVQHHAARLFQGVAERGSFVGVSDRDLEVLLAETLQREGFETFLTPRSADRGRDVIAYRKGHLPMLVLGEAKNMALVDPLYMRALQAVRDSDKAHMAILATTGRFSRGTHDEALSRWQRLVQLKDGDAMISWIQELARRS